VAASTLLPRINAAARRAFLGLMRTYFVLANADCIFDYPFLASDLAAAGLAAADGPAASAIFLEPWPLNSRVGENSPKRCPTIFSETNTLINFRPLCTSNVCPTMSGKIIERRDHVLIGF